MLWRTFRGKKIAAIAEAHYVTVAPHNPLGLISTAASIHHAASINNFAILEWHGDNKKEKSKFINEDWYPVKVFQSSKRTRPRNEFKP